MKKCRVNTTISEKHHELLKKHAKTYGTQQSVIEHALENMENDKNPELTVEEELWARYYNLRAVTAVLPRGLVKTLFKTGSVEQTREYFESANNKFEGIVEFTYNKPPNECTLLEIIEAIVLIIKLQGSSDTINHTDEEDHYKINLTHSLGIFMSKVHTIVCEGLFKSYGAKVESHYSERTVYFKVYKN